MCKAKKAITMHVYSSIGPAGYYKSICGLDSDNSPDASMCSIDEAARIAATGKMTSDPCEPCFRDPRVAMKILSQVDRDRSVLEDLVMDDEHLLQLIRLGLV